MIKVAINGFGRIGRIALRQMLTTQGFDVVAINSFGTAEEMAYLLKYDTTHGTFFTDDISYDDQSIIIKGIKEIKILSMKNPLELPWEDLNVDLVLECTGQFTKNKDLEKHILAGAKKVILSAPGKDSLKTIVYNVNDTTISREDNIISAASCTTNCLAPILKVINDNIGIEMGYMTTVHAYTSDQITLDGSHPKGIYDRRGRSAAENIVPASTGAAKAIGLVIPELNGKMDGTSLRVPSQCGSIVDLTLTLKKNINVDEINSLLNKFQNDTMKFTMDPIVSSDIIGLKYGCIIDGLSTSVLESEGKQLVKILAWYDNETGYTAQMLRTAKRMFEF